MQKRTAAAAVALGLAAALCLVSAQATEDVGRTPESASEVSGGDPTFIDSRQDLDRHLQEVSLEDSPLGLLSNAGRRHFVENATFTGRGLAGFDARVLTMELTPTEAARVLGLFGLESIAAALRFDRANDAAALVRNEAWLERLYRLSEGLSDLDSPTSDMAAPEGPEHLESILHEVYPGLLEGLEAGEHGSAYTLFEATEALELWHFHSLTAKSALLFSDTVRRFVGTCVANPEVPGCSRLDTIAQGAYDALIDTFQIDAANRFAASVDGVNELMWELPAKVNTSTPGIFNVPTHTFDDKFTLEPIDLDEGTHLIASVSTTCGPSRRALAWIEATAASEPALLDLRLLQSPRNLRETADRLFEFNRTSEALQIAIANGRTGWPEPMGFDQTPVFYFLHDGVVVETIVGWPSDETGQRLLDLVNSFSGF